MESILPQMVEEQHQQEQHQQHPQFQGISMLSAQQKAEANDTTLIRHIHLGENDVLLGRGSGANEHIGNIYFRKMVSKVLKKSCRIGEPSMVIEQDAASAAQQQQHCPEEKTILARQIVENIKSLGGRFLERSVGRSSSATEATTAAGASAPIADGPASNSSSTTMITYREVEDHVAIEKTKQSFRHQMRALERDYRQRGGGGLATTGGSNSTTTTGSKKRRHPEQVNDEDHHHHGLKFARLREPISELERTRMQEHQDAASHGGSYPSSFIPHPAMRQQDMMNLMALRGAGRAGMLPPLSLLQRGAEALVRHPLTFSHQQNDINSSFFGMPSSFLSSSRVQQHLQQQQIQQQMQTDSTAMGFDFTAVNQGNRTASAATSRSLDRISGPDIQQHASGASFLQGMGLMGTTSTSYHPSAQLAIWEAQHRRQLLLVGQQQQQQQRGLSPAEQLEIYIASLVQRRRGEDSYPGHTTSSDDTH